MSSAPKRICILGATGSIGVNTLNVVRDYPERFKVAGLSAHASVEKIAAQANEFGVKDICLTGQCDTNALPGGVRLHKGAAGLCELVEACEPELVVVATVGAAGLAPTLRAIKLNIPLALANKEVLVTAGDLVMDAARAKKLPVLSIDSELNAIAQCLGAHDGCDCEHPLRRILLTASGGPFRGRRREELASVTRAEALAHPTWTMGPKITVDSSTLMNKGFEVIEAHHLFCQPLEKIEVVIHPQSVIHSMIEYVDGSMLAQMGVTNMYLPILNALAHPERLEMNRFEPLDLPALGAMTFERPDPEAFPCLQYAYDATRAGGTAPTVLNAANEVAVARFLKDEIGFLDIPASIEAALDAHEIVSAPDLAAIEAADAWARDFTSQL